MGLTDRELGEFRKGTLHIDCPMIEIFAADGTVHRAGPGYVRQIQSGGFEVKTFVPSPLDLRQAFDFGNLQPGVLISSVGFYSFRATGNDGRTWGGERLLRPQLGGHVEQAGHTATVFCDEIATECECQGAKDSIALRSLDSVDFPKTEYRKVVRTVGNEQRGEAISLNTAKFSCCGLAFEITDDDGELRIEAASDEPALHPFLESRITEAFMFAVGASMSWAVLMRWKNEKEYMRLRWPKSRSVRRARLMPIAFQGIDPSGSVWMLFGLYLTYILGDAERFYHALSAQVLAVIKSSEGSVEANALSAVVAVESILGRFYREVALKSDEDRRSVDDLIDYLKKWPGDAAILKRAVGSVGQLKHIRPDDRLRELVRQNKVSEENVEAWRSLRNAVAHGDWSGVQQLQKFIDKTGRVHVLFYQLIFNLIGYQGKHTDWGAHGWPLIDFPPAAQHDHVEGENRQAI
jgi:hypothetical protein